MKNYGLIVPLVTPLTQAGQVDLDGLTRLVRHVVNGGVHGLFALGTTGEAPSLTMAQRRVVLQEIIRLAPPGLPVVGDARLSFGAFVGLSVREPDA